MASAVRNQVEVVPARPAVYETEYVLTLSQSEADFLHALLARVAGEGQNRRTSDDILHAIQASFGKTGPWDRTAPYPVFADGSLGFEARFRVHLPDVDVKNKRG